MKIDHIIKFWNETTLTEAVDYYFNRKQYEEKEVTGQVFIVQKSLVDINPDYNTYVLCTSNGLIKSTKLDFDTREGLEQIVEDIGESDNKGVWGRIVIHYK